ALSCRPAVVLLVLAFARPAGSQVAASPSDATVFIRMFGVVRAEYQLAWKETVESREIEVATGSGFVVSPAGYVITNDHVVSGEDVTVQRHGIPVRVRVEVKRVEVVFPSDGTRLEARVDATDPALDLAVLSVSGTDLPFLPLGDSDALAPGQTVQVIGFPFGRAVEVGEEVTAETIPQPTVSRGTVGAVRAGQEGDARYIQTDASVYPGSSGGPMLDDQGHVIGVVRMRLEQRATVGPGFGIPVNRVKDFLEANSLERVFPAPRLRLGALQSLDWKRIRFRAPETFDDASPSRLRVDWSPPQEVALLVQRVASPLALAELQERLQGGHDFPGLGPITDAESRAGRVGGRPALIGGGHDAASAGPATEVGYAILDVGKEKVVAAYVGPRDQVAFNRSILDGWLTSLEADPLLTAEVQAPLPATLERVALGSAPLMTMPPGWSREPAALTPCRGLPAPDAALQASPEGDFTVALRAGWWVNPNGRDPEHALAACGLQRDPDRPASYTLRSTRLGVSYAVAGTFVAAGDGLLQLEMVAPVAKRDFVRDLYTAWVRSVKGE
ncbi:MAG TPA: trypsin-like peptidase domain-containing protein, partial [Vicinamibacteria bacterium]|nr:trypsin-like peptidase domain-containing protein [Vicinamibacteria bacterium]